jgi:hypothetical protein
MTGQAKASAAACPYRALARDNIFLRPPFVGGDYQR